MFYPRGLAPRQLQLGAEGQVLAIQNISQAYIGPVRLPTLTASKATPQQPHYRFAPLNSLYDANWHSCSSLDAVKVERRYTAETLYKS
jgi:hypothetical protein